MSAVDALVPRFVEEVPEALEPGILYVSLEHGSMMHLCACGCGHEVALPLTPLDWSFTYDGETISISPSVGNWSLPCRSHYIIDRGRTRWAGDWSDGQIEAGRRRDQARKDARFGGRPATRGATNPTEASVSGPSVDTVRPKGMLGWARGWIVALWRGLTG